MHIFLFYRIFNLNIMCLWTPNQSYHLLLPCSKISYNLCKFQNLPFCRCPICFPLVEWQPKTTPKHWKYKIVPYPLSIFASCFIFLYAKGSRSKDSKLCAKVPLGLAVNSQGPCRIFYVFERNTVTSVGHDLNYYY